MWYQYVITTWGWLTYQKTPSSSTAKPQTKHTGEGKKANTSAPFDQPKEASLQVSFGRPVQPNNHRLFKADPQKWGYETRKWPFLKETKGQVTEESMRRGGILKLPPMSSANCTWACLLASASHKYVHLAEGRPLMASLYAVSRTSTLSQFRWMEHWWWGPGLSSGVGAARKFGSLSTATVGKRKRKRAEPASANVSRAPRRGEKRGVK